MKLKYISRILSCLALLAIQPAAAQSNMEKLQLKARVGYSIGATAPLGIPATIRSIESFSLTPNFMAGADVMYPLSEKFGLQAGLHYDIKDMDGEVTTKGYHMKVKMDEAPIFQFFSARNSTAMLPMAICEKTPRQA